MPNHRGARWLILSHAFNMDGRAASQTITDKLPHLLAAGIEPVILSGALGRRDTSLVHYQLWPWGPSGIRFELRHVLRGRTSWVTYRLAMFVTTLLLSPLILIEKLLFPLESSWSWRYAAAKKGAELHKLNSFDLVYSTGGAYAAHLAGFELSKRLGLPWLAEVHDPFVVPGSLPKSPQEKMKLRVEQIICSNADIAIWFTERALQRAKDRNPSLGGRGKVLLPGVDNPFPEGLPRRFSTDKFVIGHFGSLSASRSLNRVVQALEYLLERGSSVLKDLELHIYGGSLDGQTAEILQQSVISSNVRCFGRLETDPSTGVSGRDQVLRLMRGVDVLLLIHGEDPICEEYIPSKMYEYLWMRRPILAQVHRNPQMCDILVAMGHSVVNDMDAEGVVKGMALEIERLHATWSSGGLPDLSAESPYTTGRAVKDILVWAGAIGDEGLDRDSS